MSITHTVALSRYLALVDENLALAAALRALMEAQELMLADPHRRFMGPQAKATRKARTLLAKVSE